MKGKQRVRALLLIVITTLFVASIPWYRDADAEVTLIGGLPDWVAVALGCYVGVAFLNSIAWLLTDIEDPVPSEPPTDEGPPA